MREKVIEKPGLKKRIKFHEKYATVGAKRTRETHRRERVSINSLGIYSADNAIVIYICARISQFFLKG